MPAHFPNGIEGMRIKVAAGAAKSWNLMEAGLGIAAINSFYNTPERMAELGLRRALRQLLHPGTRPRGRTVGLIGHLRMPPGTLMRRSGCTSSSGTRSRATTRTRPANISCPSATPC